MKKLYILAVLLIVMGSVTACNQPKITALGAKNNTVSAAQLTPREKLLLDSTSGSNFVFDFKVNQDYDHLSVWIERYEFGKKMEEVMGPLSTEILKEGTIILTTNKPNSSIGTNQAVFNISISSNGSTSSSSMVSDIVKKEEVTTMSTWGGNQEKNVPITKDMILAGYAYASGSGNMRSLSQSFFSDFKNIAEEIKDYRTLYILKCEFTKKK